MGHLTGSNTPQAQKAMALIGEHNRTADYIRNNKNLTPEGQRKQIAANYLQYKRQITALEAEDKAARASKADSLRRSLFGLSGSSDANATISYRDAQDRVSAIKDEAQALELLDRADLSNDEILTKAIVGKAAEAGWGNLVNNYTAKHPYYGSKLQELANLHNQETSIEGVMNHAMSYTLSAPAEIARHSEGMIESLAAEA
ncbi:hypothetical protein ACIP9X_05615 [Arthrobacter sp. NPDC093125]|uniref:hypothetical protein n=1 Tax=Arthrobacter sp. NPDC093125 TaxID=3363944 RepID=UPI00382BBB0D